MTEQQQMRKHENTLINIGMGVIIFHVWSILKTVFSMILYDTSQITQTATNVNEELILKVLFYGIVGVFSILDLSLRLYVGRSAMEEGKGTKNGHLYIAIAILMLLFNIIILGAEIFTIFHFSEQIDSYMELIIGILVDGTSAVLLGELVYSAIMIKKLRKEAGVRLV